MHMKHYKRLPNARGIVKFLEVMQTGSGGLNRELSVSDKIFDTMTP